MAKPITIPNQFQTQVGPIPLSELDTNFATVQGSANDLLTYTNGVTDTGTTNSLVVTVGSPLTFAYALFVALDVLVSNTTTSSAPTINVNSLGAKTITLVDGSTLPTGALASGGIYRLIYDGTHFRVMGSLPGNAFFGNPTAQVGLTAINGTATSAMRSDAAPALNVGISPTWTGAHTFTGGLTSISPGSGIAAAFEGSASIAARVDLQDGQAGTRIWSILNGGSTPGAFQLFDRTRAALALTIDTSGAWAIPAPVSGDTLTLANAAGATAGVTVVATTGGAIVATVDTSAHRFEMGGVVSAGRWSLYDRTNAAERIGVTSAGNVTIAAPSSGVPLAMTGIAGQFTADFIGSATGNGAFVSGGSTNANIAFRVQNGPQNQNLLNILGDGSGQLGATSTGLTWSAAGNFAIAAPSSGTGFTVSGAANQNTVAVQGSLASGQSFGLRVLAGTTSADLALAVVNAAASVNYFNVRGDGVVFGNDGTSLFELGYKDTPVNVQSANYVLALSDRGKTVQATTTGLTFTVPNNLFSAGSVVTFLIGSGASLTIAQGSGFSMQWAGNGAATGNRTLTGAGLATIVFANPGVGLISGAGLS